METIVNFRFFCEFEFEIFEFVISRPFLDDQ